MAHEFASHRNSESKRVGHLLKSGGVAHSDAAADKKLISKMLKEHEKSEGEKHGGVVSKGRLDRSYAKGGRTKGHKKPHVQVNIISKSDPNNMPPPVVGLAGGPPAAAPGGPLPVGGKGVAPGLAPPPVAGSARIRNARDAWKRCSSAVPSGCVDAAPAAIAPGQIPARAGRGDERDIVDA